MKAGSILLVEDEPLIAMSEKFSLEKYGFSVMTAKSGEEAIAAVEAMPGIDLVLMDINLGPGMDGTEAASRILEKRELPLAFLSSHTEREVVERTEGITSYGYIVKNSGETVLIASVKMALKLFAAREKEKMQEAALRRSEERYRSIIAVSNTGGWEFHRDTGFVWCSPEYFRLLGLDPSGFPMDGRPNLKEVWMDLLHPDDRDTAVRSFRDYIAGGSVGMYENYFRIRHADGRWLWLWSRGQTLRDDEGSPTNLTVGTHIDITAHKLSEERINALLLEKELLLKEALRAGRSC